MITLNPPPPAPTNAIDLEFLSTMFAAFNDVDKAQKLLSEIVSGRLAWVAAQETAIAAMRESAEHVAANRATIASEYAEHQKKLTQERDQCDSWCNNSMTEVRDIQAETQRLHQQATSFANAAAALKERLEAKMRLQEQAAAL